MPENRAESGLLMNRAGHTLIVGCGYVGAATARLLIALGHRVTGWVRSEESAAPLRAEGLSVVTGDVSLPESWASVPEDVNSVVHCASSNRSGAAIYAAVYREGLRQILEQRPQARMIFTSSTSVYAQTSGEWVTEDAAANPTTETGCILREAEQLGLDHGAMVLRLSGIYGPDRGVLFQRFQRGEAVIEGDGLRWINQIHRDDAARALVHLLEHGRRGEIYNGSDDEPVSYLDYYRWLSERFQRQMPPFGPVNTARKRGLTNKRVANEKLRALGWTLQYPTFREGLLAK